MNFYLKFGKQILTGILAICFLSTVATILLWAWSTLFFLSIFTGGLPLILLGGFLGSMFWGINLCYSKTKKILIAKYMVSNCTAAILLLFILSSLPLSRYTGPNSENISLLLTNEIIGSMIAYLLFSGLAFFVTKYRLNKSLNGYSPKI